MLQYEVEEHIADHLQKKNEIISVPCRHVATHTGNCGSCEYGLRKKHYYYYYN